MKRIIPQYILEESSLPYFKDVTLDDMLDGIDLYPENLETRYPVISIPGTYHLNLLSGVTHFDPGNGNEMLIINILPLTEPSLNRYQVSDAVWKHYYEDSNLGYYYQIVTKKPLSKLEFTYK